MQAKQSFGGEEAEYLDWCYGTLFDRLSERSLDLGLARLDGFRDLPLLLKRVKVAELVERLTRQRVGPAALDASEPLADMERIQAVSEAMRASARPTAVLQSYQLQLASLLQGDQSPVSPLQELHRSLIRCSLAADSDAPEVSTASNPVFSASDGSPTDLLERLERSLDDLEATDDANSRLLGGASPPVADSNQELQDDLVQRGFLPCGFSEEEFLSLPERDLRRYTSQLLSGLQMDLQWSRDALLSRCEERARQTSAFNRHGRGMLFAASEVDWEEMQDVALFYRMEWTLRYREYCERKKEELHWLTRRCGSEESAADGGPMNAERRKRREDREQAQNQRLKELHKLLFALHARRIKRAHRDFKGYLTLIVQRQVDAPYRLFYQRKIEHCLLVVREATRELSLLLKTVVRRIQFKGPLASVLHGALPPPLDQ